MHLNKAHRLVLSSSLSVFIAGCGAPNYAPSEMHITVEQADAHAPAKPNSIPALVQASPTSPTLSSEKSADTYDIVVVNTPVRDLLFALARDSGIDMDIDASVGGIVTMNALDQTLDAILDRIALQVPIRIDRIGDAYVINNDEPYYQRYHVDFISVTRSFESDISSEGVGDGESEITNQAENAFWANFEDSIAAILEVELESGEEAGANVGSTNAIVEAEESQARYSTDNQYNFNTDTGILIVYAPARLQREIEQYVNESISIATRQVLLEATVVEVVLNNQYQQGIDWSAFSALAKDGLDIYKGSSIGGAASIINEIYETFASSDNTFFQAQAAAIGEEQINGSPNPAFLPAIPGVPYARAGGGAAQVITSEGDLRQTQAFLDFANSQTTVDGRGGKITSRDISIEAVTNAGNQIIGYNVVRDLNFTRLNEEATAARAGGKIPTNPSVPGAAFTAAYKRGDISAAVQLLNTFGDAKVLSSPRISVLNNQPALLRVVDQEIYFNIAVTEEVNPTTGSTTSRTYDVTTETVDVGFAMNVLPHITSGEDIYLNLKPSVTRVLDYRAAPVPPALGGPGAVQNFVPVTRVRELESVLALRDGEIAVMGGLLEDRIGDNNSSVPGLSKLPGIGSLFENINEQTFKTEFVVFIKARIIKNPSINGDYSDYRDLLPDSDFIFRDRANTGLPPRQINPR